LHFVKGFRPKIYFIKDSGQITTVIEAIKLFFQTKEDIKKQKDDFVKYLESSKGHIDGLWFRGELDYKTSSLIPTIFRKENGKFLNESKIFNYLPTIIQEIRVLINPFDKLCVMQEYDIPSRLLDWTESMLTALYFAVKNLKKKIDGKLYYLNAILLNDFTSLRIPRQNLHHSTDFGTLFRCHLVTSDSKIEWKKQSTDLLERFIWNDKYINDNIINKFHYTKANFIKSIS